MPAIKFRAFSISSDVTHGMYIALLSWFCLHFEAGLVTTSCSFNISSSSFLFCSMILQIISCSCYGWSFYFISSRNTLLWSALFDNIIILFLSILLHVPVYHVPFAHGPSWFPAPWNFLFTKLEISVLLASTKFAPYWSCYDFLSLHTRSTHTLHSLIVLLHIFLLLIPSIFSINFLAFAGIILYAVRGCMALKTWGKPFVVVWLN